MTISIRPAQESDLASAHDVWYETETVPESLEPNLGPGPLPPHLRHVLQTGTLLVAEQDSTVVAFAGAITRTDIRYLTDLFVRPLRQSAQLGQTLLRAALPPSGDLVHCTMSSSDPRALALYIRLGMTPQWPYFGLRLEQSRAELRRVDYGLDIVPAESADFAALVQADAGTSGRWRSLEHAFWIQQEGAVPLWFRRHGQTVGYAYVRLGAGTIYHPTACTIGPIGAGTAEEATACVLAAVGWAAPQAEVIRVGAPGPHPCLAPLLEAGFHISYVDTFMSTAPFFDARLYLPSGGDLL